MISSTVNTLKSTYVVDFKGGSNQDGFVYHVHDTKNDVSSEITHAYMEDASEIVRIHELCEKLSQEAHDTDDLI